MVILACWSAQSRLVVAEQKITRATSRGASSQIGLPCRERLNGERRFSSSGVKEQPMIRAIVLTVAAVLGIALTKRRRPTRPDSFDKFEMSADNLKAAVKKVDNSAAAVEVALKGLMAA
jgi:hypothetical protein